MQLRSGRLDACLLTAIHASSASRATGQLSACRGSKVVNATCKSGSCQVTVEVRFGSAANLEAMRLALHSLVEVSAETDETAALGQLQTSR